MNRWLGGLLLVALVASCKGKDKEPTPNPVDTDTDTDADTDADTDTDTDTDTDVDTGTDTASGGSDLTDGLLDTALVDSDTALSGTGNLVDSATDTGLNGNTGQINDTAGNQDTGDTAGTIGDTASQNTAPVGNDDQYGATENTTLNVAADGVLANDTDADGDALTATVADQPNNGSVTLNADGSFSYSPDQDFTGADTFTYTVSDGTDSDGPVTVTITVSATSNAAPVANDDGYDVDEDGILSVDAGNGVLDNDTDGDGDTLDAALLQGPDNGTLTLNADGSFEYEPDPGFSGVDSFTYQASDGVDQSGTATVTITVNGVNDAPVGNDDLYGTLENQPLVILPDGVLANDTDADGDALTATIDSQPTDGTVVLNATGSFTYTPDVGFTGTDSFTYFVSDGTDSSGPVTVTITVTSTANTPPNAEDDAYTIGEDGELDVDTIGGILANDSDADGDSITTVLLQGPDNGTLTLNADGSFVYEPDPDFSGVDTFVYQANDGVSMSAPATVTITVTPVNDPPEGTDDTYTIDEDSSLQIPADGVLGNDTDPEGDDLEAALVQGPEDGTLTLNADGSFVYTPDPDFSGTDSFTYLVSDGQGGDEVDVIIDVTEVNDVPIAAPDFYQTDQDQQLVVDAQNGVLDNDDDPVEGDPITAVLGTDVSNGTLVLNADGSFTYTPDNSFVGTDSFTYVANDGTDDSAAVTVTLTVGGTNNPPQANNDDYIVDEDQVLDVTAPGILDNDSDPDSDPLTITVITPPENGTLVLNQDGSFTYTPDLNFNGQDSFVYQIDDGIASDTATVDIDVWEVDDAPVAVDDVYVVETGDDVEEDVTDNDFHPDGGGVGDVIIIAPPTSGTLENDGDGNFIYTPEPGFVGEVTFTYQLDDGDLTSNVATVTIIVEPQNRAPVATDDLYSGTGPISANVLDNDADPDGDALSAVLTGQPSNGSVVFNGDGSFTYAADANFTGTDTFTYIASDGQLDSTEATVTIQITSDANQAPVAQDDAYTLDEDGELQDDVTDNDSDADSDPLSVTVVLQPEHGILEMNADGTFTYTPDADYNGPDSFTYLVDDGSEQSDVATVDLTIDPVNDTPVGNEDLYGMLWNTTLTVDASLGVLANDYDIDGDNLTVTLDQGPQEGNLTFNSDGSFEYTPPADFADDVSFTYTLSDGTESVTVTVTIEVNESDN